MNEWAANSIAFGIIISILGFEIGGRLKKKFKSDLLNPFLVAVIFVIVFLVVFKIEYGTYYASAQYLSYLLTPTTVSLAIPLYQKIEILKKHWVAILLGIASGVVASSLGILLLSMLFKLSHQDYATLLPKSITTAIGIGVSEELGGIPAITVASIVVTGILGNVCGKVACQVFRLKSPIAKGIGIGTASHAMGTSKAMEMGEIEGAMSSLAIVVAGLMTAIAAPLFALLY